MSSNNQEETRQADNQDKRPDSSKDDSRPMTGSEASASSEPSKAEPKANHPRRFGMKQISYEVNEEEEAGPSKLREGEVEYECIQEQQDRLFKEAHENAPMERIDYGWKTRFTWKPLTAEDFDPKVPRAVGAPPYRPRKMIVKDSSNDERLRKFKQVTDNWLAGGN